MQRTSQGDAGGQKREPPVTVRRPWTCAELSPFLFPCTQRSLTSLTWFIREYEYLTTYNLVRSLSPWPAPHRDVRFLLCTKGLGTRPCALITPCCIDLPYISNVLPHTIHDNQCHNSTALDPNRRRGAKSGTYEKLNRHGDIASIADGATPRRHVVGGSYFVQWDIRTS